jgi:lipoprotein-anchoring transpeptidase ErfK/SrfK
VIDRTVPTIDQLFGITLPQYRAQAPFKFSCFFIHNLLLRARYRDRRLFDRVPRPLALFPPYLVSKKGVYLSVRGGSLVRIAIAVVVFGLATAASLGEAAAQSYYPPPPGYYPPPPRYYDGGPPMPPGNVGVPGPAPYYDRDDDADAYPPPYPPPSNQAYSAPGYPGEPAPRAAAGVYGNPASGDVTGSIRSPAPGGYAALPPEDQPEGSPADLPMQFHRQMVDYVTPEPSGTIIIDTPHTYLYLVLGGGKALRYGVGVGREGFTWTGTERISRMSEWPDWHPPKEMIERQPYLPRFMAGGEGNPLGARALYLGATEYRIHGTNQPSTIGHFVSSGCIRLTNEDISDLYSRVGVGTRVVVMPGGNSASAAAQRPSAH